MSTDIETHDSREDRGLARTAVLHQRAIPSDGVRVTPSVPRRMSGMFKKGIHDLLNPEKGTIPGLDVLRSLALLLVFSVHFYHSFAASAQTSLPVYHFPLIYFGWTGVDLFFVLSGYLIGRQLWREMATTGNIQVGRFLLRRGLRIWPFYFSFLAFMVLFNWPLPLKHYWSDFVFLSNYVRGQIGGGWSLSTEEQFYIVLPILLVASRYVVSVRRQWLVLGGLLAFMPVSRWLAIAHHGPTEHSADALYAVTYAPFHTHADGLLAGLLLAWVATVHPRHLERRSLRRNLVAPVAIASVGLLLRSLSPNYFAFTGLALVYGACLLFILRDGSPLAHLWKPRIFHILSRLSYALYLNHLVVMLVLMPRIWRPTSGAPSELRFLATYLLVFCICTAAAAATFVLIESPFLQLRTAWLSRAPKPKASLSGSPG